ncbi:MAG TPA: hypothetical protein VJ397_07515 [Thermoplasmata archaeon]|nr:hypothetical protein [Thermoplasmata archaeon]
MQGTSWGCARCASRIASGTSAFRVFITATTSRVRSRRPCHQYSDRAGSRFAQATRRARRRRSQIRAAVRPSGAVM